MRFYRNKEIEDRAVGRLHQLQDHLGRPLTLPIPIDAIAERFLEVNFLWDEIEELPGEIILGAMCPERREIILNERHRARFVEKPGLERSTKGHEMGHWDLFLSARINHDPTLFEESTNPRLAFRGSGAKQVIALKGLILSSDGRELVRRLQSRADDPDEARAVNRYAAALSMPREMISEEAQKIDRTQWSDLYRLAERFDVTITALRVRLEQLDLLCVGQDGKTLWGSRAEAHGQLPLF